APFPPATARSCAPSMDSGRTRGALTRYLAPRSERTRRGPDSDLHQPVVPPVALAAPERAGLDLPADEDEEQGPIRGVLSPRPPPPRLSGRLDLNQRPLVPKRAHSPLLG